MCPDDLISCTAVSEPENNFDSVFLIWRHLLGKDSVEHNLVSKIGFSVKTPEKCLRKRGFTCAVFANDESNISFRISGEIYLFVDELSKVLQFY